MAMLFHPRLPRPRLTLVANMRSLPNSYTLKAPINMERAVCPSTNPQPSINQLLAQRASMTTQDQETRLGRTWNGTSPRL